MAPGPFVQAVQAMNLPYSHFEMSFIWAPSAIMESLTNDGNRRDFVLTDLVDPSEANFVVHSLVPKVFDSQLRKLVEYTSPNPPQLNIPELTEVAPSLLPFWYPVNKVHTHAQRLAYQWDKHGMHCELSTKTYFSLVEELARDFLTRGTSYSLMDCLEEYGIVRGSETSALEIASALKLGLGNPVQVINFETQDHKFYLKEVRICLDGNLHVVKPIGGVGIWQPNERLILEPMQRRICRMAGPDKVVI